jgi:hypothetical protein
VPEGAVIAKVMRGTGVGGLLRYLYGRGRANEHIGPHLVASWDDAPAQLEPTVLLNGRHDVRHLADLLGQPLAAAIRTPERPVWHCAVRTAPSDRRLSDAEWGDVVRLGKLIRIPTAPMRELLGIPSAVASGAGGGDPRTHRSAG